MMINLIGMLVLFGIYILYFYGVYFIAAGVNFVFHTGETGSIFISIFLLVFVSFVVANGKGVDKDDK